MKSNKLRRVAMMLRIGIVLLIIAGIYSCQKSLHFPPGTEQDHNLLLKFKAVVDYDSNTLVFGNEYKNFFDETYTVKNFKFYIHGIQMINTDSGKVFNLSSDKYFLVDFKDSLSTSIPVVILPYKYNRISFTIGVDSALNVSGAQTGALDPANGMFWTWNSGYIMAKLEGNSPASNQPDQIFEYHIGGFRTGENVIKKVTLLFPFAQDIDLKPGKTTEMTISANVNAWFYNPHDIKISDIPSCTTPGTLATQIAENYSKMFTVDSVANQ